MNLEIEENYDSSDEEGKVEYDDGGDNDNHDADENNNDDDSDEDNDDDSDDDSDDDTLYKLTLEQEEAMKKLSTIFRILNNNPIHDK